MLFRASKHDSVSNKYNWIDAMIYDYQFNAVTARTSINTYFMDYYPLFTGISSSISALKVLHINNKIICIVKSLKQPVIPWMLCYVMT